MKTKDIDKKDDRTIRLSDSVHWIGVLDYDIVTFDIVMNTEFGTTYNSYFIDAKKKTIIEAAKDKFSDVHISKLRSLTDPAEIEYIILDHTEPDHSGNIAKLLDVAPKATVVGSGNAIRYLSDIINKPFRSMVVKDGDTLDLGNRTLRFITAPNLHWPDSMLTYLEEEKILFTCDFFGAHYCDYEMYNNWSDDYLNSYRYYFDVIIKPFSRFALKAIDKIEGLDLKMICPGHGPVHDGNLGELIAMTSKYASVYVSQTSVRPVKNILVVYVSAYGYTKAMAERISEGILSVPDMKVTLRDIEEMPIGEMDSELTLADAILVGSPTINQNTLLPVYKLLSVINPLRDRSKIAGSFGSYGWSGEAPKIVADALRNLKLRVFGDPATYKFFPGSDKADQLFDYGKKFAEYVTAECDKPTA